MRRRQLLATLAAAAAIPSATAPQRALRDLFTDPARGVALGRAYLASLPEPPAAAELADIVWRRLTGVGGLQSQVAAAIGADFADGRVACVDGWIVSLTEIRICGLAALSAG